MEIENGKYYDLGKKTYMLFIIQQTSFAIILFIVAIVMEILNMTIGSGFVVGQSIGGIINFGVLATVFIGLFVGLGGFSVARLKYKAAKIMLDESAIRIVSGLLNRKEVAIPFRRIQTVEIKQSPIQRFIGVGHVVISTTTDLETPSEVETEINEEVIPLMDYDLARAVANQLTAKAEVETMKIQK
jgi:uncharacterized membrane protein YdbT with pleckstrin-like domain